VPSEMRKGSTDDRDVSQSRTPLGVMLGMACHEAGSKLWYLFSEAELLENVNPSDTSARFEVL